MKTRTRQGRGGGRGRRGGEEEESVSVRVSDMRRKRGGQRQLDFAKKENPRNIGTANASVPMLIQQKNNSK